MRVPYSVRHVGRKCQKGYAIWGIHRGLAYGVCIVMWHYGHICRIYIRVCYAGYRDMGIEKGREGKIWGMGGVGGVGA